MQREYREVARINGQGAIRLLEALTQGRPIEFEQDGDEVVIKTVTQVKPECRRDFVEVTSSI